MEAWKRRLSVVVAALGAVGMLMSSAEAREPRDRDFPLPPTMPVSSVTFPTFPTTTPPPTMPPPTTSTTTPPPTMPPSTTTPPPTMPPTTEVTLPPSIEDQIADVIDTLEEFGDTFDELIEELLDLF